MGTMYVLQSNFNWGGGGAQIPDFFTHTYKHGIHVYY